MLPSHQKLLSTGKEPWELADDSHIQAAAAKILMGMRELVSLTHPSHSTSVRWMRQLHGVSRPSSTGDARAEAQEESATNEVAHGMGGSLNCRSNDHKQAAHEDADSSAIS